MSQDDDNDEMPCVKAVDAANAHEQKKILQKYLRINSRVNWKIFL